MHVTRLSFKQTLQSFIVISLIMSLLFQQSQVVQAEGQNTVTLKSNVSVTLFDAQLLKQDSGKVAFFTLEINNNSNQSVALIDYWARIKSGSKSFVTKLIEDDKGKEIVPANTTTYLTYYANVDQAIQLNQLAVDVIKWDFNSSNYEIILGSLKFSNNGVTSYQKSKQVLIGKQKLEITANQYTMYRDQKYGYVNIELNVKNLSSSTLNMNDIQYQAVVADSKIYTVSPSYSELQLKANESKKVMVSLSLPIEDLNKDIVVQGMKKSEGSTVAIPLINMQLPILSDTPALAINKIKSVQINGNTIQITADKSSVSINDNRTTFTTKLTLENVNSAAIDMPSIRYYVKTKDGYLYPLSLEENSAKNILPKIKQSIELSGQIPSESVLATSQLVMFLEEENSAVKNFLGNFKIVVSNNSSNTPSDNGSVSSVYEGFKIEQVSLQRTPNDDMDMVIAEFKITNNTQSTQAKLNLSGQFILDGVRLSAESTHIKEIDSVLTLAPGASYNVIAYTQIPYTQNAKKFGFRMNEVTVDKGTKYINTFAVNGLLPATLLASNQLYEMNGVGGNAEVSFVKANIYNGVQTDLFYAELEYTNLEKRSAVPKELTGYIMNSKGDLINVDISHYEEKLLPGGKVVLSVWTTIPKSYEKSQLEFYFGQALKLEESKQLAVVKPVYTQYIIKDKVINDQFNKLEFMQYDLDLMYFTALLASSNDMEIDMIDMDIDYSLALRQNASQYTDEHTILVEYEDIETPRIIFSKEFKFSGEEASGNQLKLGNFQKVNMNYTNKLVSMKNFNNYKVNVYDVFKGHKLLLGTKMYTFDGYK